MGDGGHNDHPFLATAMNFLRINSKSLMIDGARLTIDWSAWPASYVFQAPNLTMQGGYAGGPVVLTKSETVGTYADGTGNWLALAAIYITAAYGGADGYVLGWVCRLESGTDHLVCFRMFSVTAAAPGISPVGLYCRLALFSSVTGPQYEVTAGA